MSDEQINVLLITLGFALKKEVIFSQYLVFSEKHEAPYFAKAKRPTNLKNISKKKLYKIGQEKLNETPPH